MALHNKIRRTIEFTQGGYNSNDSYNSRNDYDGHNGYKSYNSIGDLDGHNGRDNSDSPNRYNGP